MHGALDRETGHGQGTATSSHDHFDERFNETAWTALDVAEPFERGVDEQHSPFWKIQSLKVFYQLLASDMDELSAQLPPSGQALESADRPGNGISYEVLDIPYEQDTRLALCEARPGQGSVHSSQAISCLSRRSRRLPCCSSACPRSS
jgi:hypothetical protein